MQLFWNKGYEDYTDSANWLPRYEQLCRFTQTLNLLSLEHLTDDELLEGMEQLEELIRFYTSEHDMQKLEPVMRKFNEMISLCRQRRINGIEAQYLEMLFLRVNAMLYRGHGQNRQSAENYDQCVYAAESCFETLKHTDILRDEQKLYVGWACIECCKEAAIAHDVILDAHAALRFMREAVSMLEWVDNWLVDYPGICDQAAELYASSAGMFYQYGDSKMGDTCYHQAVRLLNTLDTVYGSDFYKARAIWFLSNHGVMALHTAGDAHLLLQCEQEANKYLACRSSLCSRDRAIVDGVLANIALQRSAILQQNGKLADAVDLAKPAVKRMEDCLRALVEDFKDRQGYYRTIVSNIASRLNNTLIGCKETLGLMYYHSGELDSAEKILKEVLNELGKNSELRMIGSSAALIQSESLQYLGIIASECGDAHQAEFYGTQSADIALALGKESDNVNAWGLAVGSCCLTAEMALLLKNKTKAAQYAEWGLSACEVMEQKKPDHPHLALKSVLSKTAKKASRKFF